MASVIKSPTVSSRAGVTGLVGMNLADFANEGRRALETASEQANQILATARQQAAEIRQQAHEEGHREGLQQAELESKARIEQEVTRRLERELPALRQTAGKLAAAEGDWLGAWNATVVGLALEIARVVIDKELQTDPEIISRWAAQAVEHARAARRLTLAVHPETLARIGDQLEQVLRAPGLPEESIIEPDESVEPSGIVLRQDGGEVDLQLSTQLAQLREQLGSDT